MLVRTAPITPEQKAQLDETIQECCRNGVWHTRTMEILGRYKTAYPQRHFAKISADGGSLELFLELDPRLKTA